MGSSSHRGLAINNIHLVVYIQEEKRNYKHELMNEYIENLN